MPTPRRDFCPECGSAIEKPGDFCLVCRSATATDVVLEASDERATITMLDADTILGETTVTTTREPGKRTRTERRNFVGRIVDEIHRKRPEAVYLAGDREVLRAVRAGLATPCYGIDDETPVKTAIERRTERDLAVVDRPPGEKISGAHTTLVGSRTGKAILESVASHPHVKKIVPGPIETGGSAGGGVSAKVTRTDENGNLRLLLRDGSSVQTNRIVTTANDRSRGKRLLEELTTLLEELEDT